MDCEPLIGLPTAATTCVTAEPDSVLQFGPYSFHARQRLVMRGLEPVRMGGRALDILQVLIEHAGAVVGKHVLIALVWPNTFVEEINLRVHIAALRRALGDGCDGQHYIETVPQEGYRFTAQVERARDVQIAEPASVANNLPARLTPVVGRDEVVCKLSRQLPARRFMTITGPGGIGKSTVACRVGESLLAYYRDGVWLIDCTVVNSEAALIEFLAQTLKRDGRQSLTALFDELGKGRCLLIFDNCEHLADSCRRWAEALLGCGGNLSILMTSRQPLGARGESFYRLSALAVPPVSALGSVSQAMGYPAVQLFVSRAQARQHEFSLRDPDLKMVRDICRRLDGLPLAIELAAAQIDTFTLSGLQAQLKNCFQLLSWKRRTAVARHQSLKASLDWSYQCLPEHAQTVLQRLAVFESPFTCEAAVDVIGCDGLGARSVRDCVAQLARYSLLFTVQSEGGLRYRFAHATRLYALQKLEQHGDLQRFRARHARHLDLTRWVAAGQSAQLVE